MGALNSAVNENRVTSSTGDFFTPVMGGQSDCRPGLRPHSVSGDPVPPRPCFRHFNRNLATRCRRHRQHHVLPPDCRPRHPQSLALAFNLPGDLLVCCDRLCLGAGRPLAPFLVTNALAILSTVIELWGRFSLGRNIGFVPAQRQIVTRGAYRFMRHPISTGLFVWIIGDLLAGVSPRNALLYALGMLWFVIKTFVERASCGKTLPTAHTWSGCAGAGSRASPEHLQLQAHDCGGPNQLDRGHPSLRYFYGKSSAGISLM